MANPQPPQQRIDIRLDEKVAEGIYSNLALMSHSPAEFFLDFARMVPGTQKASVQARIIMTPQHTKFLMNALKENIERFEKQFGEIKLHGKNPQEGAGQFGFRTAPEPEDK
ncbi:DUF3467 domain-containing protein [bacterium]|nr:DUF3467 domain-containing protein [bacterium]MBU1638438.1 DUF3467 domain-containing protein [bacterium]